MPKLINLLKTPRWTGIWLCQNLSGSVMKIFVPVVTFFKTYIYITGVKNRKLDEIGVNPSTAQQKCWDLLRVDPERRFLTLPSKAGLGAAEWVKISLEPFRILPSPRLGRGFGGRAT
jgi:hypothetical protein